MIDYLQRRENKLTCKEFLFILSTFQSLQRIEKPLIKLNKADLELHAGQRGHGLRCPWLLAGLVIITAIAVMPCAFSVVSLANFQYYKLSHKREWNTEKKKKIVFHERACDNEFIFQSHVQRAKFKISERYFTTNSIHAHKV